MLVDQLVPSETRLWPATFSRLDFTAGLALLTSCHPAYRLPALREKQTAPSENAPRSNNHASRNGTSTNTPECDPFPPHGREVRQGGSGYRRRQKCAEARVWLSSEFALDFFFHGKRRDGTVDISNKNTNVAFVLPPPWSKGRKGSIWPLFCLCLCRVTLFYWSASSSGSSWKILINQ